MNAHVDGTSASKNLCFCVIFSLQIYFQQTRSFHFLVWSCEQHVSFMAIPLPFNFKTFFIFDHDHSFLSHFHSLTLRCAYIQHITIKYLEYIFIFPSLHISPFYINPLFAVRRRNACRNELEIFFKKGSLMIRENGKSEQ